MNERIKLFMKERDDVPIINLYIYHLNHQLGRTIVYIELGFLCIC